MNQPEKKTNLTSTRSLYNMAHSPLTDADGDSSTDKELLIKHAFKTNAVSGCELLFRRYYPVLCSHAVRYVYSKELAEDIVGEVFYKFWEKKIYNNITSSYRAYLFTAVRNAALNHLKKEFGKESIVQEYHPHQQTTLLNDPHVILQADELNKLIEQTIQNLPGKCRRVFLMSRLEGRKNHEIATVLHISVKAIEAHISKALGKLRLAIEDEYFPVCVAILCVQYLFGK